MDLEAGRELDALVAEQVMGWRRCSDDGSGYWEGRSPTNILSLILEEVPHYSTDIAAAWQVIGRMRDLCWASHSTDLTLDSEQPWWAWHFLHGVSQKTVRECADTAPLAICRAALKVMADKPLWDK